MNGMKKQNTAGALAALRGEVLPKSEDESGMTDATTTTKPKAVCVVEEDHGSDMADVVEVKDEPVEEDDVQEVPARTEKSGKKKKAAKEKEEKEDVVMVDEDAPVKAAPKKKVVKKTAAGKEKGAKKPSDKLMAGKKSISSADAARRKPRSTLRK